MIQIIIIFIILLLGILIYRLDPIQSDTKNLVLSASFIMITLICKRFFTILIPLFGVESFKIGIEYIPLMLAGFTLPLGYAYLVGMCCYLIGLIIVPTGFPFFGFTLTMILVCVIPSFVSKHLKQIEEKKIIYGTIALLAFIAVVSNIYLWSMSALTVSDTQIVLTGAIKTILSLIIFAIVIGVITIILFNKKKLKQEEMHSFALWTLSVILVECVCTLYLTPLWLSLMYSIPFTVSLALRIVKEVFILPIEIFIGYILLKVLFKISNH